MFALGDWVHGIKEGEGKEVKSGFTFIGSFLADMVRMSSENYQAFS